MRLSQMLQHIVPPGKPFFTNPFTPGKFTINQRIFEAMFRPTAAVEVIHRSRSSMVCTVFVEASDLKSSETLTAVWAAMRSG